MSTIFGEFADRREAFAAANPIDDGELDPSFDYDGRYPDGNFWFDFVADLGDGWNSTFAIARLLAEDKLEFAGVESLPRGSLLIMGGDEVYPTPSADQYYDRLIYPYSEAYGKRWPERDSPDLYAVPGNHDWYDGLRAFFPLFCRRNIKAKDSVGVNRPGKMVGGRRTQQTRSYFALRLPKGWWLWGRTARSRATSTSRKSTSSSSSPRSGWHPSPSSSFVPAHPIGNMSIRVIPRRNTGPCHILSVSRPRRCKGHQLKLLLSGDSHHYARYHEKDLNFITCGGGGAFLHPTHNLCPHKKFEFPYPAPGQTYDPKRKLYERTVDLATKDNAADADEALFPSRAVSRRLSSGLPLFRLSQSEFHVGDCRALSDLHLAASSQQSNPRSAFCPSAPSGIALARLVARCRLGLLASGP